jgi:hypothetical protein
MVKTKKKDSPTGTPITTPTTTPERPTIDNHFAALQTESDIKEEKSVGTIDAEESQFKIKNDHSNGQDNHESNTIRAHNQTPEKPHVLHTTPEEIKQNPDKGPIAEILPTDLERMKESIPIFASNLTDSVGELFPASEEKQKPAQTSITAHEPVSSTQPRSL